MAVPATPLAHPIAWETRLGRQRIVFGDGALANLGQLAREAGMQRVLLVSDPGLVAVGHTDRAAAAIRDAGLGVEVFAAVGENPGEDHVAACAAALAAAAADGVVAVGGGSAMDCAKAGNLLARCGGKIEDYWGFGRATAPLLPAIGVPTTAGTGSEAQAYALVTRAADHRKLAIGDDQLRFATVLLDPALVATTPLRVTALAGMDALSHAVESYVSRRANPISRLFAADAWRLLVGAFPGVLTAATPGPEEVGELAGEVHLRRPWTADAGDPLDDGIARMLLGAHLAGHAIDTSMLGAAHALANPLTARHGVAHGAAVGLFLPQVVRFNAPTVGERYTELEAIARGEGTTARPAAGSAGDGGGAAGSDAAAERLAGRLEELRGLAGLPERLRDLGLAVGELDHLAAGAAEQWTAGFNPRVVDQVALRQVCERCW